MQYKSCLWLYYLNLSYNIYKTDWHYFEKDLEYYK